MRVAIDLRGLASAVRFARIRPRRLRSDLRGLASAVRFTTVALGLGAAACGKSQPEASGTASSVVAAPSAPASAAATPGAGPSAPAAAAAAGAAQAWKGTYKSAAATLTVPPAWKKIPWSDAKSTAGVGDGAMTLALDPGGRATGSIDGPLGPATIDGASVGGKLSATVRRKDPGDHGFTGTLVGDVAADRVEGTMSVSLGQASALRTATFTLAPGGR
jgi:hypothetical protein